MDPSGILNARQNFNHVLQDVCVRASSDEGAGLDNSAELTRQAANELLLLPSRTPDAAQSGKRAVGKSPRKRQRLHNENKGQSEATKHVMTVFDRSVDLAQFDMESPLYVICRAWMKNLQPGQKSDSSHDTAGLDLLTYATMEEMGTEPVFHLPRPAERESETSTTMPVDRHPPTRPEVAKASIDMIFASSEAGSSDVPSQEQLVEDHLRRWRTLREGRRRQTRNERARHAESFQLLSQLKKSDVS